MALTFDEVNKQRYILTAGIDTEPGSALHGKLLLGHGFHELREFLGGRQG